VVMVPMSLDISQLRLSILLQRTLLKGPLPLRGPTDSGYGLLVSTSEFFGFHITELEPGNVASGAAAGAFSSLFVYSLD